MISRFKSIGSSVMIGHTLFSLPFAVSAFILESGGRPGLWKSLWIIAAVFGARNAANGLNRLIDYSIDAENPRTAGRGLQSGRVGRKELLLFIVFCGALFFLAAWMLNPFCLLLAPVAAVMILGYSYTKRFTWLCHYWLGLTCSAAVMGSFLALKGSFAYRFFPLTGAVALWVAGFDIIYALQDLDHDRKVGLHSVPARFAKKGAFIFAAVSFSVAVFLLIYNGTLYKMTSWYYAGTLLTAVLMVVELLIAFPRGSRLIPFAAYRLNQVLSPLFLGGVLLSVYLPGGLYG